MEEKRMTIAERKAAVCACAKRSYQEKLFAGTSGNLSAYDEESGRMVITPTSVPYEEITPEDMVVMDLDGTVYEGTRQPSSEWRMHAAVYQAKPETGAIIHTHSPYATAFAVNHRKIPVILIEMVPFLGGDIPLARFAYPGTAAVGEEAVKVLRDRVTLSHARPTTAAKMETITRRGLEITRRELAAGHSGAALVEALRQDALDQVNAKYLRYAKVGAYLADQIPRNGTIMTQCFAETVIGTMLRECRKRGNDVKLICPETRPSLHHGERDD